MSRLVCHDCARDARFEIAPAASVARVDLRPVESGGTGTVSGRNGPGRCSGTVRAGRVARLVGVADGQPRVAYGAASRPL